MITSHAKLYIIDDCRYAHISCFHKLSMHAIDLWLHIWIIIVYIAGEKKGRAKWFNFELKLNAINQELKILSVQIQIHCLS